MSRRMLQIVSILVLLAGILLFSLRLVSWTPIYNNDFFTLWLSGFVVAHGQNVYDSAVWLGWHHFFGVTWLSNLTDPYPLPLGFLFVPFARLPLGVAFAFWDFASLVSIFASTLVLADLAEPAYSRKALIPLLGGVIAFRPVIVTLLNGQLAGFLFAALVFSVLLYEKEYWFWGGFTLSLLFLKPTIGFPVAGLVVVWFLICRRWSGIAGVTLGGLILLCAGLLENMNWIAGFLEASGRKFSETFGFQPSIWGMTNYLCQGNKPCAWLAGGAGVVLLFVFVIPFLLRGRRLRPLQMIEVVVPAGLLVTPYLWAYDQIFLLIPVAAILFRLLQSRAPYLISALFALAFSCLAWLLLGLAAYVGLDIWSGLLSVGVLVISLFTLRHLDPQENP